MPKDLQDVVEIAGQAANMDMLSEFMFHNAQALKTLTEEHGVQIRRFPDEVMREFQRIAWEYFEETSTQDPLFVYVPRSIAQDTSCRSPPVVEGAKSF